MMEVELLAIPKKKAMEEYEAYKEELRHSKTQFNQDMLSLYAHMKHGGKVIDVYEAMKIAGINKDGDPKIAIIRADQKKVRFEKSSQNIGYYSYQRNPNYTWDWKIDVTIPEGFFPTWEREIITQNGKQWTNIKRSRIETIVPMIPAKILNPLRSHKLENYHILWEVEEWKPIPPKDPMLLKRITPNMFVVLGTWDLTPLERAVIRGRI